MPSTSESTPFDTWRHSPTASTVDSISARYISACSSPPLAVARTPSVRFD